jgi:hypothetical protein
VVDPLVTGVGGGWQGRAGGGPVQPSEPINARQRNANQIIASRYG